MHDPHEDWSEAAEPVVLLAEVRSCNGTTVAGGHLAHSRRCPVHGELTYELAALRAVGWLDPTAAEALRTEQARQIADIDRQWCANIDAAGMNLEPAVTATIAQLRTERDELQHTVARLKQLLDGGAAVATQRDALLPVAAAVPPVAGDTAADRHQVDARHIAANDGVWYKIPLASPRRWWQWRRR